MVAVLPVLVQVLPELLEGVDVLLLSTLFGHGESWIQLKDVGTLSRLEVASGTEELLEELSA